MKYDINGVGLYFNNFINMDSKIIEVTQILDSLLKVLSVRLYIVVILQQDNYQKEFDKWLVSAG